MEQVQRRRDEREGKERQTHHTERDVQDKPGVASGGGFGAGREPDQQREPDETGGHGSCEKTHGGPAHESLRRELQQHQTEGEHRERGRQTDERDLGDGDDVQGGAGTRQGDRERTRRGAQPDEGCERQRRGQSVQRQGEEMQGENHGTYVPGPPQRARPPVRRASS